MDNSIYIMVARQDGLFRDLAVTANNLANVNTTGYKSDKLMFSDYLVQDNDRVNAFPNDPSHYRDLANGGIKLTGNNFDLAISGNGYFQVQTPLGVRYTRAGNFQTDGEGTMVDVNGYQVLGADGGPIAIPDTARTVAINGAGQIMVDGEDVGQVGIMEFTNEQALKRLGNNLYSSNETPIPSESARVVQGAIESSNVEPVTEMVRVIDLNRSVGSTAKFIEIMYDLQRKTSSTYARSQQG